MRERDVGGGGIAIEGVRAGEDRCGLHCAIRSVRDAHRKSRASRPNQFLV
jgi:hypothetical protein